MKYYINYSDKIFRKQQKFALKMAKKRGNFDSIIGYSRKDIDKEFYGQNKDILNQKKGGGYWLWKPYLIYKTLNKLKFGDYLFYSDSGAFFLKSVDILINELEKYNQDIMGFELSLIELQWTKRELFINMDCNKDKIINSNQIFASFMLIKKTKLSIKFFREYLKYGCNEINITDKYINYIKQRDNFIDHRHDQSIFSLLYKKYNLRPFKDPSQFGYNVSIKNNLELKNCIFLKNGRLFRIHKYVETYNMVLYHSRKNNIIKSYIEFYIKLYIKKFLYKLKIW